MSANISEHNSTIYVVSGYSLDELDLYEEIILEDVLCIMNTDLVFVSMDIIYIYINELNIYIYIYIYIYTCVDICIAISFFILFRQLTVYNI